MGTGRSEEARGNSELHAANSTTAASSTTSTAGTTSNTTNANAKTANDSAHTHANTNAHRTTNQWEANHVKDGKAISRMETEPKSTNQLGKGAREWLASGIWQANWSNYPNRLQ